MHDLLGEVDLATVPVRSKAHDVLKRGIIEGRLPPGQRLIESQLAEVFSVSRTPLREAILQLEAEGFLQRAANGAIRVKRLTIGEVQELYAVRSMLEGLATREAAGRLSAAHLEHLERLVQEVGEVDDAMPNVRSLTRLGERFHQIILDASGNRTCTSLLRILRDRIDQYRHFTISIPGRGREAAREMSGIVKCLRDRDAHGAERAMREHVLRAGECLLLAVKGKKFEPGGRRDRTRTTTPLHPATGKENT